MPIRSGIRASLLGLALITIGCEKGSTLGPSDRVPDDSLDAQAGRDKRNKYDFLQGNLLSTGRLLDLGIEGNGLFVLKNGESHVYFRRPANFGPDAEGYLTLGNAKVRLQGIPLSTAQNPYSDGLSDSAFAKGVPLSALVDIRLPFHVAAPPRATTRVRLARNLDSDAQGKGSVLYTQRFLHHAEGADLLVGLTGYSGDPLGIQPGDLLTFSATVEGALRAATFTITETSTLSALATALTAFLRNEAVGAGLGATAEPLTAPEEARGALALYGNTGAIRNFQVTSSRPVSGPKVAMAFAVPADIPAGTTRLQVTTDALRSPAQAADPLGEVFDATGNRLGLEEGDAISVSGSIGGTPASIVTSITFVDGPGGTVLGDVMAKIKENFKLPEVDGTPANHRSVALNPAGSDDNIPDGSIVVRGQPGTAFAIRDVSLRASDRNGSKPSPNFFNTNANATTLRDAVDTEIPEAGIAVFDATGKEHVLTLRFTPTITPGQWYWEARLGGDGLISKGARGILQFGHDGSVASFASDAGDARLEFDPMNGSAPVSLTFYAGAPGDFSGLTQFRSVTTAALVSQDGFPAGMVRQISIGEDGIISASYTNGQSRNLFRIPLADFANRKGLGQVGTNSFVETAESGKPAVSFVKPGGVALIRPGALEYLTDADFKQVCETYPDCAADK